jgi:hypothetical protein
MTDQLKYAQQFVSVPNVGAKIPTTTPNIMVEEFNFTSRFVPGRAKIELEISGDHDILKALFLELERIINGYLSGNGGNHD